MIILRENVITLYTHHNNSNNNFVRVPIYLFMCAACMHSAEGYDMLKA